MKTAIIFDALAALGPEPDVLILEHVETVERALESVGHEVVRVPVTTDARWIERLRRGKFDLVYNLCEGIDGVAELEPPAISVLELLGVPFTGNSSFTLAVCLRKGLVNAMLHRAGLPVPRWFTARRGGEIQNIGFPAICKPAAEDASIGIEQKSVVRTMRELRARVGAMHQRWEDVVVQRYIEGREINVGILGDHVLPISEIDFSNMPPEMWRMVTYRSKWFPDSDEDVGAKPICPAPLSDQLRSEVERVALAAWSVVGGRGYGRVDMRIDADGTPWILEVNPNADISPDAGLPRMAAAAGMSYQDLVLEIATLALNREQVAAADAWAQALELSGAGG